MYFRRFPQTSADIFGCSLGLQDGVRALRDRPGDSILMPREPKKMENTEKNQQRYVMIDGKQIAVTEEVYLAYKRPLWAEHKRRERESICQYRDSERCTRVCRLCDKECTSRMLSLERFAEEGFEISDPVDTAELVENKLLVDALHTALNKLDAENLQIANLFSAGLTEREIAVEVGLSQKGVNKRKQKIFELLREQLKDFR